MRILGIDYGDARVGVAVSDPLVLTAQGVGTIKNKGRKFLMSELDKIIKQYSPETIVIGLPKNMDGSEGPRADLYREFAALLEELLDQPVVLWDERRTTIEAHQILSDGGYHGKKRKNTVDAVAASLILEGYLNYLPLARAERPALLQALSEGARRAHAGRRTEGQDGAGACVSGADGG